MEQQKPVAYDPSKSWNLPPGLSQPPPEPSPITPAALMAHHQLQQLQHLQQSQQSQQYAHTLPSFPSFNFTNGCLPNSPSTALDHLAISSLQSNSFTPQLQVSDLNHSDSTNSTNSTNYPVPVTGTKTTHENMNDSSLQSMAIEAVKQLHARGYSMKTISGHLEAQFGTFAGIEELFGKAGIFNTPSPSTTFSPPAAVIAPNVASVAPSALSKKPSTTAHRPKLSQQEYAARLREAQAKKIEAATESNSVQRHKSPGEEKTQDLHRRSALMKQDSNVRPNSMPSNKAIPGLGMEPPLPSPTTKSPEPLSITISDPTMHIPSPSFTPSSAIPGLFINSPAKILTDSEPYLVASLPADKRGDFLPLPTPATAPLRSISPSHSYAQDSDLESGEIKSEASTPQKLSQSSNSLSRTAKSEKTQTTLVDTELRKRLQLQEAEAKLKAKLALKAKAALLKQRLANKNNFTTLTPIPKTTPITPIVQEEVFTSPKILNPSARNFVPKNETSDHIPADNAQNVISSKRKLRHASEQAAKRARVQELERELARIKTELTSEMDIDDLEDGEVEQIEETRVAGVEPGSQTPGANQAENMNYTEPHPAVVSADSNNPDDSHRDSTSSMDQSPASDSNRAISHLSTSHNLAAEVAYDSSISLPSTGSHQNTNVQVTGSNTESDDSSDSSSEMDMDDEESDHSVIHEASIIVRSPNPSTPTIHDISHLIDEMPPELQTIATPLPTETKKKPSYYTRYKSPLRDFRAYRYHPDYKSDVTKGFESLTFTNRIDPTKPICLTELDGNICTDPTCHYQHFKDMSLTGEQMLYDLGFSCPINDVDATRRWDEGITSLVTQLKTEKISDAEVIATRLVQFRREFFGDQSRVLNLGNIEF